MAFDGRARGETVQSRRETVAVPSTGVTVTLAVTFDTPFAVEPEVWVQAHSTTPQSVFASPAAVTETGFDLKVHRTATTGTTDVSWQARVS